MAAPAGLFGMDRQGNMARKESKERAEEVNRSRRRKERNMGQHGRNNLKRLKSSAALGRQSDRVWPRQAELVARRRTGVGSPNFSQVVKFVYA